MLATDHCVATSVAFARTLSLIRSFEVTAPLCCNACGLIIIRLFLTDVLGVIDVYVVAEVAESVGVVAIDEK